MTDNKILARWQGRSPVLKKDSVWDTAFKEVYSDYLNDDAAAMSLLDTLVEKGYIPHLFYNTFWHFEVYSDNEFIFRTFKYTRREAIITTCLEVARKELEV